MNNSNSETNKKSKCKNMDGIPDGVYFEVDIDGKI